jgi:hypothetical protein
MDAGQSSAPDGAMLTTHQPSIYPPDFVDWIENAGWIFTGTVTRLHAATEDKPFLDPSGLWDLGKMIVVKTDRITYQRTELLAVGASENTLVLKTAPTLHVGDRAYFLATWWFSGVSNVFIELGEVSTAGASPQEFDAAVLRAQAYWADRAVYDRMTSGTSVVEATVGAVHVLPGPIVDNLPLWSEATVTVDKTLLGATSGPITVRFDAATTPCCSSHAKLSTGDQVILLLRADSMSGAPGTASLVFDPLDVQPLTNAPHLSALLASPPQKPQL